MYLDNYNEELLFLIIVVFYIIVVPIFITFSSVFTTGGTRFLDVQSNLTNEEELELVEKIIKSDSRYHPTRMGALEYGNKIRRNYDL